MTRDAEQNAPTGVRTNPITVHVDLNSQGGREVALPDRQELITLETLDDESEWRICAPRTDTPASARARATDSQLDGAKGRAR